jgi:molybdopterin/thiamine biosynthesis adenylyltransferase
MRTWTERYPGRLEYELERFVERSLHFELDEGLLADQGRVVLRGQLAHQGREVALEVRYPDLYPFVRPEVLAPDLRLRRHQNPYAGNLCLLDRSTRAWKPSYDAAWLVGEKVPYLLALLDAGEEAMRKAEAPQGEPFSTYFRGVAGTAIFVPEAMRLLPAEAATGSGRIRAAGGFGLQLRGAVVELVEKRRRKTHTLASAEPIIQERFQGETLSFRWARLAGLPEENTPIAVLGAIKAAQPGFGSPARQRVSGGSLTVSAAVFDEEVGQGVHEDSWLFVVQFEGDDGQSGRYLIRGERLSRRDIEVRLPGYVRLGERRVALAGLGALGGELALELARSGVGGIRGLDFDEVEVGNGTRWIAGVTAVGAPKTAVLDNRIRMDYPFTAFEPVSMMIGGSTLEVAGRSETEIDLVDRFLSGADLLIDATAEIGVQQALAASAEAIGLTQLFVSATEGARGGIVARLVPGSGGCWLCLQLGIEDGKVPLPGHAEPLTLQPQGCNSLTYTAASFDLAPITAQAARVAASTLSAEPDDADGGSSIAFVCSLETRLSPPVWQTVAIELHPDCPNCGGRE